ncbi:hypothetical protein FDECE_13534 [Fusarium decemcellulare]|nr:hypothetical protein FDECE_13534 [Fusarium decemcellulare]
MKWSITVQARGVGCAETGRSRTPACGNCLGRGSSCPGYGDVFDKAHRDESVKTRRRHSHRSNTTSTAAPELRLTQLSTRIPPGPPSNDELDALGFFFFHYGRCYDGQATCSIFDILPSMYAKCSLNSPLVKATTALALEVAYLHRSAGGYSVLGHSTYIEAVIRTKEALTASAQSKSNELLMTTLVLEAYENAHATFGKTNHGVSPSHAHALGSIALLKHRGSLDYKDELSWRLVVATRNRLLQHTWHDLDGLGGFETLRDVWDCCIGAHMYSPAVKADTLAFRLPRVKLRARTAVSLHEILNRAINLASECSLWQNTFHQLGSHVDPAVYASLSIANSYNRHRVTELCSLSLISDCLASLSSPEQDYRLRVLPPALLCRAQVLVDEICASVPFLTGDAAAGGLRAMAVLVPSAVQPSHDGNNATQMFPWNEVQHAQQVVASGLFMMYRTLKMVLELLGDKVMGNIIRDGQIEWSLFNGFGSELWFFDLQDGITSMDETWASRPDTDEDAPRSDDLAAVLFTSGSTGQPKGVMLSHQQLIDPFASCAFDVHLLDIFCAMFNGATLCQVSQDNLASNLSGWGQDMAVDAAHLTPSPVTQRIIQDCGDKVNLINLYGPCEASSVLAMALRPGSQPNLFGTPPSYAGVHVLDDSGMPVAVGVEGEIYCSGASVALGYLGDDAATERSFRSSELFGLVPGIKGDVLHATGDWGMLTDAGELILLGRRDSQIKINGQRIDLALFRLPVLAALVRDSKVHSSLDYPADPSHNP